MEKQMMLKFIKKLKLILKYQGLKPLLKIILIAIVLIVLYQLIRGAF